MKIEKNLQLKQPQEQVHRVEAGCALGLPKRLNYIIEMRQLPIMPRSKTGNGKIIIKIREKRKKEEKKNK